MVWFKHSGDHEKMTQIGWWEDFSYDFYKELLEVMRGRYTVRQIYEAAELANRQKQFWESPNAFLRHDIDVSVEKALKMASIEFDERIQATYFVRMNTKYYDINDEPTLDQLMEIKSLGHEIGLHYDGRNDADPVIELNKLEDLIDDDVLSVSFHIPTKEQMESGMNFCGRVNAYAKELRVRYKSDSSGIWRDGNPLEELKSSDKPIQLAIHPIWWGEKILPHSKIQEIVPKLDFGW